jgi:hypothetical protein
MVVLPFPEDRCAVLGPVPVGLFVGEAAEAGEVGADAGAVLQEFRLGAVAADPVEEAAEELDLGCGVFGAFVEAGDDLVGGDEVAGLDLDEEVLAQERGLGGGGGEALEFVDAGVGDLEQALVGAGVLDDLASADESVGFEAGEFGVDLLGEGVPEVRDARVEVLGELVAAEFGVEQGGQDGRAIGVPLSGVRVRWVAGACWARWLFCRPLRS